MAMVATREMTVQGRSYDRGDLVEMAALAPEKLEQLLALRILEQTGAHAPQTCVVLRRLTIGGRDYKRGDQVNVVGLPSAKVSQLLEHRMLDLLAEPVPTADPAGTSRRRRA